MIDVRSMLTAQRLRKVLSYDRTTGIFRWKVSRGALQPALLRIAPLLEVISTLALFDGFIRGAALLGSM
jgi:hypothetical protein